MDERVADLENPRSAGNALSGSTCNPSHHCGRHVSQRCVDYDYQTAASTALRNGRADWAKWIETGRA